MRATSSPTVIFVHEAHHLCGVQLATRELCRTIGLSESEVFQAVIAVSELAHRLFIDTGRPGKVTLNVVRTREGRCLEARAADAEGGQEASLTTLTFPSGVTTAMS